MAIGAVLSQLNKSNVEQPLAYYSRSLSNPERKYAVTRKEMLALVDSLRHFRCYLIGKKFKVLTDHSALQWLRNFKEPVGQVARWIERLAEYEFEIVHRPGHSGEIKEKCKAFSDTRHYLFLSNRTQYWHNTIC